MSNYSSLKSAIDANIKANGRREITGPVLNAILNAVVNSLGDGYLFRGVAIPSTNPGTPDQNVAYLAITEGTYTHMGGLSVTDGELSVFSYNGAWSKIPLALVPTKTSQLDNDLRFVTSEEMGESLSSKQDTIQDLETIRSGAAKGETSVQPLDIEDMVKAEPIGSIIPPVNPSEFATKEEVGQLQQKVGDTISQIELEPISTYTIAVIRQVNGTIGTASAASAIVNEYNLPDNTQGLKVSGRNGVSSGYCMLAYFDSSGVFLSYELPNNGTGHNVVDYDATIPSGAKKILVAGSDTDLYPDGQPPVAVVRVPSYGLTERVSAVESENLNLSEKISNIESEFYASSNARIPLTETESYTYATIDSITGEIVNVSTLSAIVKDYPLLDNYSNVLVSGRMGATTGRSMIAYFGANNAFLGTELPNTGQATDVVGYSPTIPEGTTMIRVAGSSLYQDAAVTVQDAPRQLSIARQLNILVFGNSYSYDAFGYLPALLIRNLPYVKLNIGILYQGHCSLAEHLTNIENNTAYPSFATYDTSLRQWVVSDNSITALDALSLRDWDIIMLQQNSANSRDYSTYSGITSLINAISERINYPVKFGWLLTPAWADGYSLLSDTSDLMFEDIANNAMRAFDEMPVEFVIPVGTALQNARHTSLDSLGTFGHLTYDGTHLQEGIPCLVEAYTVLLAIADLSGCSYRSIIGEQTRPTASWIAAENVPQQHGSATGVNSDNVLMAQKCAIMAIKHSFELSIT